MRYLSWTSIALALFAAGCGDSDPVTPEPSTLAIVSGNQQTGAASAVLPVPLTVRLTDDDGEPLAGRTIRWIPDGATVTPGENTTNAQGEASTTVTLGTVGGNVTVRATSAGAEPITFSLMSTGPEPLIRLVATVPIPANYGIHDTYIRDGLAFVSAWNTGLRIYDVGNGMRGGLPAAPVLVSSIVTTSNGVGCICVHNSWWFHNPTNGEKRYVFVGQEGPASIGNNASGDIHVIDISNINTPVEVATLSLPGAGTHNFWMDEARQILYAAYYNGGVIAVDVSGTLTGSLNNRIVAQAFPGGTGNTYVWGVHLTPGALYVSDMLSGFWALNPVTLATIGGGNNVPDRFSSDLWVSGNYGYSGTWSLRFNVRGNAIKIWDLSGAAPTLADSLFLPSVNTVSDVGATPDGKVLVATGESGTGGGLYLYDLVDPLNPVLLASVKADGGIHTGKVAVIGGRTYVFAAKNPGATTVPALLIYDITASVNAATGP